MRKYSFPKTDLFIGYVYHHLANPTPIRLHKALYFIWAYYAGGYGQLSGDLYPQQLFAAQFVNYKYGPACVEALDLNSTLPNLPNKWPMAAANTPSCDTEIHHFVDDLIQQCNNTYDFKLAHRAMNDMKYWAKYITPLDNIIPAEFITKLYEQKLNHETED